jgi:hypothetical protein
MGFHRSYVLGDRTEEIAELVKMLCEEERDEEDELETEQDASSSSIFVINVKILTDYWRAGRYV